MRDNIKKESIPFLSHVKEIIVDTNNEFCELSGFEADELIGKPFKIIWNQLLLINVNYCDFNTETETFLFTKSLDARNVNIKAYKNLSNQKTTYLFTELPNSRFEDKNQFVEKLISDDITGVGIYTAPDFLLIRANQTYLNYLPEQFRSKNLAYGKLLKDIIIDFKGSDGEKIWNSMVNNNQSIYIKEKQHIMLGTDDRYWNNTITPITENGKVKYIVSILEDVTTHVLSREHIKKQAEEIDAKNKQLEAIIESIEGNIAIFDKDGKYLRRSTLLTSHFGPLDSSIHESIEKSIFFDLEGNLLSKKELCPLKIMKGKKVKNQKLKIITGDNEVYIDISGVPILNENNEFEMGVMFSVNISEIISMTKQIIEQKEELEAVIENIDDAIFIYDKDKNYYMKNKAARDYFPNTTLITFGDTFKYAKYFDSNNIEIPFEQIPISKVLNGQVVNSEKIKIIYNDSAKYISISGRPVYNADGSIRLSILCSRDITEEIKKELIIKNQQKLLLQTEIEKRETLEASIKLKDEFLYLITHEFRTPIAVVSSALQAIELMCKGEATERVNRYLNTIKQNTNRQLRLVNNLLDITRINSGHIKLNRSNFDIVHITKEIVKSVEIYANQKRVNLNFSSSITKKQICLDDEKFERILLNLLANALKFTPQGKNVNVSIFTKKRKKKSMICISVNDEGIGIKKDRQKIIFERFGQADTSLSRCAEGLGLGLYLVNLLVTALDGEVILESEEGKGSTFTVMLPAVKLQDLDEIATSSELCNPFIQGNNRLIESAAIEFSDIYF